jgi:phage terminase small subunit
MGADGDATARNSGGRAAGDVVRGLSALQARFVEQYLLDGNATQAAIRAGYSAKSAAALGSRALRMPQVQVALAERQTVAAGQWGLDPIWVLGQLRVVAERCLQGVPVRDRSGQETGEWSFNASGATRALELIGKHLGMFSERIDVQLLRSEVAQVAAELGLDEQAVMEEADRWLKTLRSR